MERVEREGMGGWKGWNDKGGVKGGMVDKIFTVFDLSEKALKIMVCWINIIMGLSEAVGIRWTFIWHPVSAQEWITAHHIITMA